MICRGLRPEDFPEAASIWRQAFGDDNEFIAASLSKYTGLHTGFVAEAEGSALAAQLFAIPVTLDGVQGVYMYALATKQALRGQGIMPCLMRHAEAAVTQEGAAFACLIPSGRGLFPYYTGLGYTQPMEVRLVRLCPPAENAAQLKAVAPAGYWALRRRWLPHVVDFGRRRTAFAMADYMHEGWLCSATAKGCAVWRVQGAKLLVAELGAENDAAALRLLAGLCAEHGCRECLLSLPPGGPLFAGQGRNAPFALGKAFGGYALPKAPWLRFGFEDSAQLFES